MENGAAELGTGLLRAFGNVGDPFNSAILLMCPREVDSARVTDARISPYGPTHISLYGHMGGSNAF